MVLGAFILVRGRVAPCFRGLLQGWLLAGGAGKWSCWPQACTRAASPPDLTPTPRAAVHRGPLHPARLHPAGRRLLLREPVFFVQAAANSTASCQPAAANHLGERGLLCAAPRDTPHDALPLPPCLPPLAPSPQRLRCARTTSPRAGRSSGSMPPRARPSLPPSPRCSRWGLGETAGRWLRGQSVSAPMHSSLQHTPAMDLAGPAHHPRLPRGRALPVSLPVRPV